MEWAKQNSSGIYSILATAWTWLIGAISYESAMKYVSMTAGAVVAVGAAIDWIARKIRQRAARRSLESYCQECEHRRAADDSKT